MANSVKKKRTRWKSEGVKYNYVYKHVLDALGTGEKTFWQLLKPVAGKGITDHFLSDVLGDLFMHDNLIDSKLTEDGREVRSYYVKPNKKVT